MKGFLKRLAIVMLWLIAAILSPAILVLGIVAYVVVIAYCLIGGFFQWLFTGKTKLVELAESLTP